MPDFNSAGYKSPINPFLKPYCTWYAFGRIYELGGSKLSVTGDASAWFNNAPMSKRYSTPSAQRVACWSGGPKGQGHVGVIEKVYSDGSFDYSEANFDGNGIFDATKDGVIIKCADLTAMKARFGSSFNFQGFIGA